MAGPRHTLFATAALAALMSMPTWAHAGDGVSAADAPGGTTNRARTWTTPPPASQARGHTTPATGGYAAPAPTYVMPADAPPPATTYAMPSDIPTVPYVAPESQTFSAPAPPPAVTSTPQRPSMRRNNGRRTNRRGRRVQGRRGALMQQAPVQFRFAVGDEILISIWDKDVETGTIDLRQRILRDGTISPLWLDPMRVQGRTIAEVRGELVGEYEEYYKLPRITVGVVSIHQERAFVLGEVTDPAAISLNGPQTLLQVLAQAGGILPTSGNKTVRVVRAQGQGRCPRVMRVNTANLCRSFMILPGDVVYVHATGLSTWSRDMVTALAPLQSLFGATGGAAATYLAFDQISSNSN